MCDSCEDAGLRPLEKMSPPLPKWQQDRLWLAELMIDLDRCAHGRHYKDPCSTCRKDDGVDNTGNWYLQPGTRIGTTLYGRAIVVPGLEEDRYDPNAWISDE